MCFAKNNYYSSQRKSLITHPTFLLAGSSEMRLDCVQIDFRHCRLDVVNVEATFNNTRMSDAKTLERRRRHDRNSRHRNQARSAGWSIACMRNLEWPAERYSLSHSAAFFKKRNRYIHAFVIRCVSSPSLCIIAHFFGTDPFYKHIYLDVRI